MTKDYMLSSPLGIGKTRDICFYHSVYQFTGDSIEVIGLDRKNKTTVDDMVL